MVVLSEQNVFKAHQLGFLTKVIWIALGCAGNRRSHVLRLFAFCVFLCSFSVGFAKFDQSCKYRSKQNVDMTFSKINLGAN